MTTRIFVGDCREVLKGIPDGWYQTCVTSPPYWGLRDYGTEGQVWGAPPRVYETECTGGHPHIWGDEIIGKGQRQRNGEATGLHGDRQTNKLEAIVSTEVQQGAFCILCGAWRGNLGLEPTPALYVQHMVEVFREVWRVLRDDGTVWLNLGDSYATGTTAGRQQSPNPGVGANRPEAQNSVPRCGTPAGLKTKDLVGIPWRVALALQADGWWLRSDIIWHKPNCMPESVTDRPTKSHEYIFLLTKSARYFFDADAVRKNADAPPDVRLRSSTFSKAGKVGNHHQGAPVVVTRGRNIRTVWTIPTRSFKGAHFATFPPALVTPCIKAGSSERGACPSCGSPWRRVTEKGLTTHDGTTESAYTKGMAANRLALLRQAARARGQEYTNNTRTTGWQPTCGCDAGEPVPCRILDNFGGACTVAVEARRLGRDCDIIELSPVYADMGRDRLDATPVHTVETGAGAVEVQQMAMFSGVTVQ